MPRTEEELQSIKDQLPYRYSGLIKRQLFRRFHHNYTEQHIRRSLMFKHQNERIIQEAERLINRMKKRSAK